jgi:hypothetical protein
MKTEILLFYFLTVCVAVLKGQDAQLKSFKITAVTFGITTPMSVSCSEFENAFSKKIYVNQDFNDSFHVLQLGHTLSQIKFAKKNKQRINVRARIYLEYGAPRPESILCVDKFYNMELDGRLIRRNKALINYLKQFLKSFQ